MITLLFTLFSVAVAALGNEEYVTSEEGNMNLVLLAPHGGWIEPEGWPDRRHGCLKSETTDKCYYDQSDTTCTPNEKKCRAVTAPDRNTQEVSRFMADEIEKVLGTRPYIVTNNVRRNKMDANRDLEQAAQGFTPAEEAYRQYHDACTAVIGKAKADGPTLVLDMHGNGHKTNMTEIGYLIPKYRFKYQMDDSNYFKKWFVLDDVPFWNLLQETGAGLEEFVYGEFGLGALLLEEGNDALPSPKYQDKWPTHEDGEDFKYFSGGFDVREYGNFENDPGLGADAIQIESPEEARWWYKNRDLESYSRSLGRVAAKYFKHWYIDRRAG